MMGKQIREIEKVASPGNVPINRTGYVVAPVISDKDNVAMAWYRRVINISTTPRNGDEILEINDSETIISKEKSVDQEMDGQHENVD